MEQGSDLNTFFNRFDTQDFTQQYHKELSDLPPLEPSDTAPFTVEDVRSQLTRCKPGKAPGLDSISARVLKTCASELAPVIHSLYHESYDTCKIPSLWKKATIIPIPKSPRPKELNDFRPIAQNITAHEMPGAFATSDHHSIGRYGPVDG